jgi:hypothetical protein
MASSSSHVIEAAMNRTEWVNPENTPKSITHLFDYKSNGQLERKSYISTAEIYSDYVEFVYENDRIIRLTGYYKDAISGYTNYIYDNLGNIIKEMRYFVSPGGITELTTTTEYEYDRMHNPYQSFKRLITPGTYTNPNNIVKETYTLNFDVDRSIEKVQVTENSYKYNEMGYPVEKNDLVKYLYK